MTILLDTCVLVDFLRGKDAAVAYLDSLDNAPAISVVTVMELTAGARGQVEKTQMAELFAALTVHDVNSTIAAEAGEFLAQYARSHSVDPPDALIAATARCLDLDLKTLNIKHFPMFKTLARPYKI